MPETTLADSTLMKARSTACRKRACGIAPILTSDASASARCAVPEVGMDYRRQRLTTVRIISRKPLTIMKCGQCFALQRLIDEASTGIKVRAMTGIHSAPGDALR